MRSDNAHYLEPSGPFQGEVGEGKPVKLEEKTEDPFRQCSALSRSEAVGRMATLKSPAPQRLPGQPPRSLSSRVGRGCDRDEEVSQARLRGCPKVAGALESPS